ncbi:methyltransferase domain-containing protein [Yinghuangia seranimata]|uniref:methyltransferase domain-containing protein n=1 Tax=Yinghuangia seranimata TaxID=408067 RepID=UPI00248B50B6|nr:methyltransferase domain-containing protein [Yinghuangia seranimata]MDI2128093.1 methyltransferase domain-containing protein [Yinghuangia seranimata]
MNSYTRELHVDLPALLRAATPAHPAAWLDLCCGSGRALVEAASLPPLAAPPASPHAGNTDLDPPRFDFTGVDLVDFYVPAPWPRGVRFATAPVAEWSPPEGARYDLITCVHGLHYVGDRLGLLARAATWLAPEGVLAANLDVNGIRLVGGASAARRAAAALRAAGFVYDARRKLVTRRGPLGASGVAALGRLRYVGADDQAGPNYTGQPAVDAYYSLAG